MKDVREWQMWNWDIFVRASDDRGDVVFKTIVWIFAVAMFVAPTLGILADCGIISVYYLFLLALSTPLSMAVPHLSKKGVLYGLENEYGWGGDENILRTRTRAVEYYSLSKEDRRQYPANIMEIIRDKDLTRNQKVELDKAMEQTYAAICQRNKAKRILARRNVDIDHMLEYMKDARHGLNVERKTYEEYLRN